MADTIRVNVRYHGELKQLAGTRAEEVALPSGALLGDVLRRLAMTHGPQLQNLLFPGGEVLSPQIVVFYNGRLIPTGQPDRAALPLADGDELMLFFATSGG